MEDIQTHTCELATLMKRLSCDLIGIATFDEDNCMRWKYMLGNLNGRYRHMVIKRGHGLAGHIIRFGRTMIVDQLHPSVDYASGRIPIMISEQLMSAIAAPIYADQRIIGVLLIGDRRERTYTQEEIQLAEFSTWNFNVINIKSDPY